MFSIKGILKAFREPRKIPAQNYTDTYYLPSNVQLPNLYLDVPPEQRYAEWKPEKQYQPVNQPAHHPQGNRTDENPLQVNPQWQLHRTRQDIQQGKEDIREEQVRRQYHRARRAAPTGQGNLPPAPGIPLDYPIVQSPFSWGWLPSDRILPEALLLRHPADRLGPPDEQVGAIAKRYREAYTAAHTTNPAKPAEFTFDTDPDENPQWEGVYGRESNPNIVHRHGRTYGK